MGSNPSSHSTLGVWLGLLACEYRKGTQGSFRQGKQYSDLYSWDLLALPFRTLVSPFLHTILCLELFLILG